MVSGVNMGVTCPVTCYKMWPYPLTCSLCLSHAQTHIISKPHSQHSKMIFVIMMGSRMSHVKKKIYTKKFLTAYTSALNLKFKSVWKQREKGSWHRHQEVHSQWPGEEPSILAAVITAFNKAAFNKAELHDLMIRCYVFVSRHSLMHVIIP